MVVPVIGCLSTEATDLVSMAPGKFSDRGTNAGTKFDLLHFSDYGFGADAKFIRGAEIRCPRQMGANAGAMWHPMAASPTRSCTTTPVPGHADSLARGCMADYTTYHPGFDCRWNLRLIQSAKLNGHDPYVYLKDVLARLPTHKNTQIEELLPHRWQPTKP